MTNADQLNQDKQDLSYQLNDLINMKHCHKNQKIQEWIKNEPAAWVDSHLSAY